MAKKSEIEIIFTVGPLELIAAYGAGAPSDEGIGVALIAFGLQQIIDETGSDEETVRAESEKLAQALWVVKGLGVHVALGATLRRFLELKASEGWPWPSDEYRVTLTPTRATVEYRQGEEWLPLIDAKAVRRKSGEGAMPSPGGGPYEAA